MSEGNILLIVDEEATSQLLKDTLDRKGYELTLCRNAHSAIESFKLKEFDLIITKYKLPDMEGVRLVREIRHIDPDSVIMVVSDHPTMPNSQDIFGWGVYDYVTKPFNLERFLFVIKRAVDFHRSLVSNRKLIKGLEEQKAALQKQNTLLAKRIEESTKNLVRLYEDLRETYMRTITALAQAIDAKDHYTHSHSENVTKYAVTIANEMLVPQKETELIREACQLHDLGKIGIHDSVLTKPGPLNQKEWEEVKFHALKGAQILEPLAFLDGAIDLVKYHHERYDGKGYPTSLKGENIPLGARIMQLADSYDAMTSARPYRTIPLTKQEAIEEIKKNTGTQFDPVVVEAFLRIIDKF